MEKGILLLGNYYSGIWIVPISLQDIMNLLPRLRLEWIFHVLFWSIPAIFIIRYNLLSINELLVGSYMHMPFYVNTVLNIVLVYGNIFLLYPEFKKKHISALIYWTIIISAIPVASLIKAMINQQFCIYYFSCISAEVSFRSLVLIEAIVVLFFMILSTLYCLYRGYVEASIVNGKLVRDKDSLELNYLKAQIQPHFLFNTLNNLYALALTNRDTPTASGLAKLSRIMRYMLKDTREIDSTLDAEIAYLQSYIDLQLLRYSEHDRVAVTFDVQGDPSGIRTPPFLFIVFVENAFKHGVNFKKESFIKIDITVVHAAYRFTIINSIHSAHDDTKNGTGLVNVKKRLLLLYPGRHTLHITDENNVFTVNLEVSVPP